MACKRISLKISGNQAVFCKMQAYQELFSSFLYGVSSSSSTITYFSVVVVEVSAVAIVGVEIGSKDVWG